MSVMLDICDCCGGDGGGEDYDGNWYECGPCGGEGYLLRNVESMQMTDADEIEADLTPTQELRAAMWNAWAEAIAEQIGI